MEVLETNRLILRPTIVDDHIDLYNNIFSNKKVLKYYVSSLWNKYESKENLTKILERFERNKALCYSIILKETGEVIGYISECQSKSVYFDSVEIAYALGEKYWNNSYMTEAFSKFTEYELTRNIHKIKVSHIEENTASKRVIEKCGFTYEGTLVHELYYHDTYYNLCYYYILNEN